MIHLSVLTMKLEINLADFITIHRSIIIFSIRRKRINHIENGTVDFLDAHTLFSKRVKENHDFEIKSSTPLLKLHIKYRPI